MRRPSSLVIGVAAALVLEAVLLSALWYGGRGATMGGLYVATGTAAIEVGPQRDVTSTVTVARVLAPADGWVVVTSPEGTSGPAMPIGVTHVDAGESRDVRVELNAMGALPDSLTVALWIDLGAPGRFEADMERMEGSVDRPLAVDGHAVAAVVAIETHGEAVAMSEAMLDSPTRQRRGGDVVVARVIAPAASWLVVIEVAGDGSLGAVVGSKPVRSGETTQVAVPVPGVRPGSRLEVGLVADRGAPGVLEFDPTGAAALSDELYYADGMPLLETVLMPY